MSANLSTLHKAASQNFLLDGNKFFDLESLIGFTEYRIFCTKPYHGRTHHAKFSNTNSVSMFNYTIGESHYRPSDLCNGLQYMSDDTSKTRTLPCQSLRPSWRNLNRRLYDFPWYVLSKTGITVWNNFRMDCDDDFVRGYKDYGTWLFYVK